MKKKEIDAFHELLRTRNGFVLTTHLGTDGDAAGSLLAFYQLLKHYNKEVQILWPGELANKFSALPAFAEIKESEQMEWGESTLVVLDCSELERALDIGNKRPISIVNIDHHQTNRFFGDLNWVDSTSSSTGEILGQLFLTLPVSLPSSIWQYLLYAIYADTGGFRFENTSAACLALAAKMVERGARPALASEWFFSLAEKELRILGIALANMAYYPPIAYSLIPLSTGITVEFDSDYIMNIWRLWPEPVVYVLFKEVAAQTFKISMRSRQGLDLTFVAGAFGGGGHPAASGCTIQGSWPEVKDRLFLVIEEALTKWKAVS